MNFEQQKQKNFPEKKNSEKFEITKFGKFFCCFFLERNLKKKLEKIF